MGILSSLFGGNKSGGDPQEKQNKKNFEILKYDGIRARNMRQLPYAIRCFEQAIALNEDPETLQLLASAYAETGQTDEARITLDRLVRKTPDDVRALLSLANICYVQEDYESMGEACRKALALDGTNATACYLSARAEHAMKNDLQAIVMLTKAIAQHEEYIAAYLLRAEVLSGMGQLREAMDDIEKLLSLHPGDEEALLLKGRLLLAAGNAGEACQCFDQVMEANPFNEKAYLLKGGLLVEQKNTGEAIKVYDEALELMPDNARFYQERGRARLLEGDKDGSVDDMKKALELAPDTEKQFTGNYGAQPAADTPKGIY